MKRKRILLVTLIFLSIVVLQAPSAKAGSEWYICSISEAGPAGSNLVLFLLTDTNGAFTNKWFYARSDRGKEQLATGLAAICNNTTIRVYADTSSNIIQNIYLRKE